METKGGGLYTTPAVVPNPVGGASQITVTATAAGGTARGDLVTLIVQ